MEPPPRLDQLLASLASPATPSVRRAPPRSREELPVIPDHELIRCIGQGAYGEVWLARSVLGTYRAVKIVFRDSFSSEQPYEREFRGIQRFEPVSRSNDGLMDILQVGRNDAQGCFYYVMELADDERAEAGCLILDAGSTKRPTLAESPASSTHYPESYRPKTLARIFREQRRLPAAHCIQLGLSLTSALGHLHGHGLIHRDIKPSNIIFVEGVPKLADIGLVVEVEEAFSFVGTEGYIPPEGPTSPQADLYSLGKVLYEASNGKDRKEFPEPMTGLRELSDRGEQETLLELNAVILKACETDVRERYQSAEAFHADLALLQSGKSVRRKRRLEKRVALLLRVAVATGVIAGLVALATSWLGRSREGGLQLPVRLAVDGAAFWRAPFMARQFDFSPDGERIVFAASNSISIWESKTRINRRLELTGIGEWKPAGTGVTAFPRWAPDSRRFVFQAHKRIGGTEDDPVQSFALLLVNADTGDVKQIGPDLPAAERANDLCWRPDGEAVTYVSSQRRLMTVTLKGEQSLWKDCGLPETGAVRLGDYSSDGSWLLVSWGSEITDGRRDGEIWMVPNLGGPGKKLTQSAGMDAYPTWVPDGGSVYYVSDGGQRESETWGLWKIEIDRETMLPKGPTAEVFVRKGSKLLHPKFVAVGRTLAYAVAEPKTDIWVGAPDAMASGTITVRGQDPVLSPDGQTIYFVGERPDQQGVFAINRSGNTSSLRKVTELKPLITGLSSSGLRLSPDGELLALFASDGNHRGIFVAPASGGESRLVEEFPAPNTALPIWSPDGQWLAYAVEQGLVRVSRDGQMRETMATLPTWHGWSVRWSPDGAHIAAFGGTVADKTSEECGVYVVAVATKTLTKITPDTESQWKEGLEWHPSSEYVTYMIYGPERLSAQIRRAWLDGRPTDLMIQQPDHWDYLGDWAPDGRRFFFTSSARNEKDIHLYDAPTAQIIHGLRNGGMGGLPRWSRDGSTAVWAIGDTLRYFEMVEDFR